MKSINSTPKAARSSAPNGVTGGVWRVTAGDRPVVLKVLTRGRGTGGSWDASDDPRHWLAFVFLAGWAAEARELATLLGFPPAVD